MGFFRFIWQKHKILSIFIALVLIIGTAFATNFVRELIYFSDPANLNRPVEPWMSMRLVAQSWGLPKEIMIEALGYKADTPIETLPKTVAEYLTDSGLKIEELQQIIEDTHQGLEKGQSND